MKKIKLLLLLFCCFPLLKAQEKIITFSYNNLGNSVSQNVVDVSNNNKVKYEKENKYKVFTHVFPSPIFKEQISLFISGLRPSEELSYIMTNASGQIYFSGIIKNGRITLSTNTLSSGLYIINLCGVDYKQSYKLFKN